MTFLDQSFSVNYLSFLKTQRYIEFVDKQLVCHLISLMIIFVEYKHNRTRSDPIKVPKYIINSFFSYVSFMIILPQTHASCSPPSLG